jgi:hypothetical protein
MPKASSTKPPRTPFHLLVELTDKILSGKPLYKENAPIPIEKLQFHLGLSRKQFKYFMADYWEHKHQEEQKRIEP